MDRISECRSRIYDHFHGSQCCQSHFFDKAHADDYAAYYTAMYLLQDSTEGLSAHRARGFASDPLLAYIELWGIMQAIIIQQDSIKKLYELLTGTSFPKFSGKWKEIRDLRVLCSGHPVAKGKAGSNPQSVPSQEGASAATRSYLWKHIERTATRFSIPKSNSGR